MASRFNRAKTMKWGHFGLPLAPRNHDMSSRLRPSLPPAPAPPVGHLALVPDPPWPWVQGRFQEEVAMAVGPRTTALEVKERVALEAGMPPELQLIAFNGCPLEASPMLTSPEP